MCSFSNGQIKNIGGRIGGRQTLISMELVQGQVRDRSGGNLGRIRTSAIRSVKESATSRDNTDDPDLRPSDNNEERLSITGSTPPKKRSSFVKRRNNYFVKLTIFVTFIRYRRMELYEQFDVRVLPRDHSILIKSS